MSWYFGTFLENDHFEVQIECFIGHKPFVDMHHGANSLANLSSWCFWLWNQYSEAYRRRTVSICHVENRCGGVFFPYIVGCRVSLKRRSIAIACHFRHIWLVDELGAKVPCIYEWNMVESGHLCVIFWCGGVFFPYIVGCRVSLKRRSIAIACHFRHIWLVDELGAISGGLVRSIMEISGAIWEESHTYWESPDSRALLKSEKLGLIPAEHCWTARVT